MATRDILFWFNEKSYKQIQEVAMGSPLRPTLADIFICHIGNIRLQNYSKELKPIHYYRYVHDT